MTKPLLLLVDDDPGVLEALEAELAPVVVEACRIETYSAPEETLAAIPRWQEERRPVAVAVVDQKMPGMSGVDLIGELRDRSAEAVDEFHPTRYLHAILLTGYADLETAVRGKNAAGVSRYLEKPWESAELAGQVRSLVGRSLADSGHMAHYRFREITLDDELLEALTLRHAVRRLDPHGLTTEDYERETFDVHPHDLISRFFGMYHHTGATESLVGVLRVVEQKEGPAAGPLRRLVAGRPALQRRLQGPRPHSLPLLERMPDPEGARGLYWSLRRRGEHVFELGRFALAPGCRLGFAGELYLARHAAGATAARYFFCEGVENGMLACETDEAAFYAPLGFREAEGTEPGADPETGREIACLHGRREWIDRGKSALLQPVAARIGASRDACYCEVNPACLPDVYESGTCAARDLCCPAAVVDKVLGSKAHRA